MAKSFQNLVEKLPKESRKRIEAKKEEIFAEIRLRELRQALDLTQSQLAETLKVNQAAISKMESQSDMYISTLRRFLTAMGGSLKIVAEFPHGQVVINQFLQEKRTPKADS
jgi:predicted transcriptional regulator